MNHIFRNIASLTALTFMFTACSDWTEQESIGIHYPSFEEQNPQLYADYIKNLNDYKAGEHKTVFVSFENPTALPGKQAERLNAVPDSVDFICLNNPDNLPDETQAEMVKIREKNIRTLYSINYEDIEKGWTDMEKANPELTEEDAQNYLNERTNAMLALCDKYGYDGIVIDYPGRSMVSMQETPLQQYKARQNNFFGKVLDWQNKHAGKVLAFYGNVQFLTLESIDMLDKYNYLILKTATSKNAGDLTLGVVKSIQAGAEAAAESGAVNPVPTDRFVASAQLPRKGDKDMVIGYWDIPNNKEDKTLLVRGTAQWIVQASPDYDRSGIFIMNIQEDYYNDTYRTVRETIQIMNPNK